MKNVMLMILDGYGISQNPLGDATKLANKPNIDKVFNEFPHATISASGKQVGLPEGQMGNSEVGHTNIGAGRIIYQDLTLIDKEIEEGNFFEKQELFDSINNCKQNNSNLHIFGLVSDGCVHSSNKHLYALLEFCKQNNFSNVYVHAFLDGRDTMQTEGKRFLQELEDKMNSIGVGKIASIMGRYYAMDRDNRWERIQKAYDALVKGVGIQENSSIDAITHSYENNVTDEFVIPTVISQNGTMLPRIKENDSIIFFNFRFDRARQITRAFVDEGLDKLDRQYFKTHYLCFTEYDKTIPNVKILYKPQEVKNSFGEYISNLGLKQLRIAETEKYAHVTFYFNGGNEKVYKNEDRILIPSPKVATYDLQPQMSAYEVKDKVVEAIRKEKYNAIILNFANCDMVGHTGIMEAAIKAIEAIDSCVGEILEEVQKHNYALIVTADHGNIEQMIDYETNLPFTAHTTNLVPISVMGLGDIQLNSGKLADLAPTMLDILEIEKPKEMTGQSLIIRQ